MVGWTWHVESRGNGHRDLLVPRLDQERCGQLLHSVKRSVPHHLRRALNRPAMLVGSSAARMLAALAMNSGAGVCYDVVVDVDRDDPPMVCDHHSHRYGLLRAAHHEVG